MTRASPDQSGGTVGIGGVLFATMRLGRKVVQGGTVALLAVCGAQLAMWLVVGEARLHLGGLAFSVGLPSFLAAVLLFPLSRAVATSRWRLGGQVLLFTAAVCAVNRLLVFRVWERDARHAALIPDPGDLDGNAKLLVAAMLTAVVMAFLAQPMMASAARRV